MTCDAATKIVDYLKVMVMICFRDNYFRCDEMIVSFLSEIISLFLTILLPLDY